MVWILAVVVVVLVCSLVTNSKKLKNAQRLVDTVADADAYSIEKKVEADAYYSEKHAEGLTYYNRKVQNADARSAKAESDVQLMRNTEAALQQELKVLELNVLCGMVSIDAYENLKSDEIKNQLSMLRTAQDELIKNNSALNVINDTASKRVIDSQKKQILRCFNAECSNIIESVTAKNVDASRAKVQRAYDAINKIFQIDGVQISTEFLSSKFEEMSMVYAYMIHDEEEREQRKAIREQMVEEEKVRREIEREKQKIEKEENQFMGEVNKLMAYMQQAKDDIEKQLYIDKIQELDNKLKALAADKENVLEREQNTRAGFVYIISNIGSFGESIYKIGMTRRLDPMDRISELSSASVPFPFDVHAVIFSADAPSLETLLHHHFQESQVNKVNSRKEFFHVDLQSIKELVLESHNATVKFIDVPDALEYRETIRIEQEQAQV